MISDTVTTRTALIVSDLYNELWDIEPPHTTQDDRDASAAARRTAKDQGWAPPLAWDDIDTDPHPNTAPATPDPGDLDEIAIERAIAGDSIRLLDLTPAEQAEVVDRLTKSGKSIRDIAGYGDLRLATVGGLGLGHTTHRSLVLAVLAFMAISIGQASWTYVRTRDRKAHFGYGPALALGFLVAAAAV
jgi:hypothetical protein